MTTTITLTPAHLIQARASAGDGTPKFAVELWCIDPDNPTDGGEFVEQIAAASGSGLAYFFPRLGEAFHVNGRTFVSITRFITHFHGRTRVLLFAKDVTASGANFMLPATGGAVIG